MRNAGTHLQEAKKNLKSIESEMTAFEKFFYYAGLYFAQAQYDTLSKDVEHTEKLFQKSLECYKKAS